MAAVVVSHHGRVLTTLAAGVLAFGAAAAAPPPAPPYLDVVDGLTKIKPGQSGPSVVRVQRYLNGVGIPAPSTGVFDRATEKAVLHFQDKFQMAPYGRVNQATAIRLQDVYGTGRLPNACRTTVRIVCVDKTQKTARLMVKGTEKLATDVRFGSEATPTRHGRFRVFYKDKYLISGITGTPMPYSLFFSGGQALHFSAYFQRDGYNGASHGCVNIRDRTAARYLFRHVPVGTPVYIYTS